MNNVFNVRRFSMLFKKHSIEHGNTYLLSTAVLIGLLFLSLGFFSYTSRGHLDSNAQTSTFIFFMLIGGSIFTSLTFLDLGDKKKSIPFLTLPASHTEKYLVAWIYSFVIFQLVFLGAFYLVANVIVAIGVTPANDRERVINVFDPQQKTVMTFTIYALFHGLTIWGAIFFEKLHFIKTSFVFFIGLAIILLINSQLLNLLIGKEAQGVPFQGMGINNNNHFWQISPDKDVTWYGWYIFKITVLLLWTSAFFRLKEKEV